jgi:hypothetical protein
MQRLSRHPDGKALLQYLEQSYMGPVFDKDPLVMAQKAAEHDLVDDLLAMTRERSNETEE